MVFDANDVQRAGANLAITLAELILYLILTTCLLILGYSRGGEQIIKVRGSIPLFFLFLQLCRMVAELVKYIIQFFLNAKLSESLLCNIDVWFTAPIDVALLVLMTVQFVNYFVQKVVNEKKEDLAKRINHHFKKRDRERKKIGQSTSVSTHLSECETLTAGGMSATTQSTKAPSSSTVGMKRDASETSISSVDSKNSSSATNKQEDANQSQPSAVVKTRRDLKTLSSNHDDEDSESKSTSTSGMPSSTQSSSKISALIATTISSSSLGSVVTKAKKKLFLFLLFMADWKVMLTFVIVFFFSWYMVSFSLLFTYAHNSCTKMQEVMYWIIIGFVGVVMGFILIVSFIDFVTALKSERRKMFLKHFFSDDDPMKYRLEFYLYFVGTMLMFFAIYCVDINLENYFNTADETRRNNYILFQQAIGFDNDTWLHWAESLVLLFLFRIPIMAACPGILIYNAMKARIEKSRNDRRGTMIAITKKKLSNHKIQGITPSVSSNNVYERLRRFDPSMDTVLIILHEPEIFELFKAFCVREFSIESILLYMEIQQLKNIKNSTSKKRHKKLKMMIQTYMSPNSPLEINLPAYLTEPLKLSVQFYEERYLKSKEKRNNDAAFLPAQTICQTIERALIENMIDSYHRFFYTKTFKAFLESKLGGTDESTTSVASTPKQTV